MTISEELRDEVEALNSIYGDGSLIPSEDDETIFILQLPGEEASSLKIQFSEAYPSERPEVLGTQHSSGGKMGAGARDLGLFRDALTTVWQGEVCLFDAVEEFARLLEEEEGPAGGKGGEEGEDGDDDGDEEGQESSTRTRQQETAFEAQVDFASLPAPPWVLSDLVVDTKSTFIAHVAKVTSTEQANLYLQQLLASDKKIRSATHNISAWRIHGGNGASFQDCDDDGETAAGGRVLHLMQLMDVWDVMVVVTRWYGGVKLGSRRFAVINSVARDGFVKAGLVKEKGKK